MKKMIALLLCALLILSLIPASALAAENEILDGRWLCADIQGNVTENTPAALKDDFGLYVNKEWILQAEIPDGESSAGSMEDVSRTLKDRQIALLKDESLTGHDAELVHKLYALVSDWDYRNAQGVEPAMPIMEAIRAGKADLAERLAGEHMHNAYENMVRNGLYDIYKDEEET